MRWQGVFPAITTPFRPDLSVDHDFLDWHVQRLVAGGSRGIVALGSLGESSALSPAEKIDVLSTCRRALGRHLPLVVGIAALSTAEAVDLARRAESAGCDGLMVLPPWVYRGDWRETSAHLQAVISATRLSCMLYNNPVAYGTDVLPAQMAELAANLPNLHAVKESSGDVRRITAIRELLGERLAIFVGVDDVVVESVRAGAVGWIAGLVNAFPEESVQLFELASSDHPEASLQELYERFLPLLRLDTGPKFVQAIKLVQQEVGVGSERVRPPRLPLAGAERDEVLALIRGRIDASRRAHRR